MLAKGMLAANMMFGKYGDYFRSDTFVPLVAGAHMCLESGGRRLSRHLR